MPTAPTVIYVHLQDLSDMPPVSMADACDALDITPKTLRKWMEDGKVAKIYHERSGKWRIPFPEVIRIKSAKQKPEEPSQHPEQESVPTKAKRRWGRKKNKPSKPDPFYNSKVSVMKQNLQHLAPLAQVNK